jgi:ATP-dependent RNA helicase DDX51/DBP6
MFSSFPSNFNISESSRRDGDMDLNGDSLPLEFLDSGRFSGQRGEILWEGLVEGGVILPFLLRNEVGNKLSLGRDIDVDETDWLELHQSQMLFKPKRFGLEIPQHVEKRRIEEVEAIEEIESKEARIENEDEEQFDEKQGNVWTMANKTLPLDQVPLCKPIIKCLEEMKLVEMYPVQRAVIPATLSLHKSSVAGDILVGSPTGSGKTLAYCLPIQEILSTTTHCRLRVIILVPTNNLVIQVEKVFKSFKGHTRAIPLALTVDSFEEEQKKILSGCTWLIDILICTPQKLSRHLKGTPHFSTKSLEFLVIDEADRLISNPADFVVIKDLCKSRESHKMEMTPIPKQFVGFRKLLFSATLKHNPAKIFDLNLNRPQYFTYNGFESVIKYTLPDTLKLFLTTYSPNLKPLYLFELFEMHQKIIVFCVNNEVMHRLHVLLTEMKVTTLVISSNLKSSQNQTTIETFSKAERGILLTTDLMGRGMDLPDVDCIINYDLPPKLKTWIHRIGRCARGMKEGTAYTLLKQEEMVDFRQKLTKVKSKTDAEEYMVSEERFPTLMDSYTAALDHMKTKMKKINKDTFDSKMDMK